jgi:hypothetical protein
MVSADLQGGFRGLISKSWDALEKGAAQLRKRIADLHREITHLENKNSARNRHLPMLRAVFNKGIQWRLVVENPTRGVGKLRERGSRTRFLDNNEIQHLLEKASDDFKPLSITALSRMAWFSPLPGRKRNGSI